ncbi:hypothetical protein DFH28DRAFT_848016, partial [Melampsora americana]
ELKCNSAYRIQPMIAAGGNWGVTTLFEDLENPIVMDNTEVQLNCMVNKVMANGIGRIVHW